MSFWHGEEWWEQRDSSDNCFGASGLVSGTDRPHFELEVEINHLFMRHRDNQQLLNQYIIKISETVFNGLSDILSIMVNECKNDEIKLNKILDIIQCTETPQTNIDINKYISSFDILSATSIGHICSFLDREDIISFKCVSYDICILCLQHMSLYRFGICNVKKLIYYPSFYSNIYYLNYKQLMNYDVYSASRTVNLLQEHFYNIYNIPIKYQLLINKSEIVRFRFVKETDITKINIHTLSVQQFEMTKRRLFLFDTRYIIAIYDNNCKPKILSECKELTENDLNNSINWKFQILQYFDVQKQWLYPIQILIIHSSVQCQTILQYIQNKFIATCPNEQKWFDNFTEWQLALYKSVCYGVRSYPRSKERIFEFIKPNDTIFNAENVESKWDTKEDTFRHNRVQMLVIQMNKYCVNNNSNIKCLKEKYSTEEKIFCDTIIKFAQQLDPSTNIKFKFLHKQSLLKSYLQQFTHNLNDFQLDAMLNSLNNIKLNINSLTTFGRLRVEISDLISNIIPAKNIELYSCDDEHNLSFLLWNDTLTIHDLSFCSNRSYFFDFVTHNVTKMKSIYANTNKVKHITNDTTDNDEKIVINYYITIYKPNQCLVPKYEGIPRKILLTFSVKYLSRFKLNNQFIKFIMDEISAPIYGNNFKKILMLYKSDNKDIMYALSDGKKMYYLNEEYIDNKDEYLSKLSLMIFYNPLRIINHKNTSLETVCITMRFDIHAPVSNITCCGYGGRREKYYHIASGIPFKTWIKKDDTLQIIVKRYLKSNRRYTSDNYSKNWRAYIAKFSKRFTGLFGAKNLDETLYLDVFANESPFIRIPVEDNLAYQPTSDEFIVILLPVNV